MIEYKNSFRQLIVWQESKNLTLLIYKITKNFPSDEKFAMVSQIRRAAYSVLANIAEGNSKRQNKDRCNYFNISQGSLSELECFIDIAKELNYIDENKYKKLIELINKTNYLLIKFIKSQS